MRSLKLAFFAHLTRIWYRVIGAIVSAIFSVLFVVIFLGAWYYFETIWR